MDPTPTETGWCMKNKSEEPFLFWLQREAKRGACSRRARPTETSLQSKYGNRDVTSGAGLAQWWKMSGKEVEPDATAVSSVPTLVSAAERVAVSDEEQKGEAPRRRQDRELAAAAAEEAAAAAREQLETCRELETEEHAEEYFRHGISIDAETVSSLGAERAVRLAYRALMMPALLGCLEAIEQDIDSSTIGARYVDARRLPPPAPHYQTISLITYLIIRVYLITRY